MQRVTQRQQVTEFIKAAFECTVYLAPRDPGLTHAEVLEIGRRAGFEDGEIGDAIQGATAVAYFGDSKLKPGKIGTWSQFHIPEEPDYRNVKAFDSVARHLQAMVRSEGRARARMERSVLVERAKAEGIPALDVEAAITIMALDDHLVIDDKSMVQFAPGRETYPLASEQVAQMLGSRMGQHLIAKEARARAYPIVKDVIERRSDGRPQAAEPIDAFADALDKLGYGRLRLWWKQLVGELRRSEANSCPALVAVSAAALVEGALTCVVKHARDRGLGVFGSKDFERPPTSWKIDDLVSSAAAGRESAILDAGTKQRADELVRVRQRIHAGRMLVEFPVNVPDLRPEEARAAKETAEVIVRRVLDWLERYPMNQKN